MVSGTQKNSMSTLRKIKQIKYPRSSWIHFCKDKKEALKSSNPGITFGDISKKLGPLWKSLSHTERGAYRKLYENDKKRYQDEIRGLDKDEKSALRVLKLEKKKKRRERPTAFLSSYMFFATSNRARIIHEHAGSGGISFQEIGRKLGEKWNKMTPEEREPFVEKSRRDRERYTIEMELFRTKQKEDRGNKRQRKKRKEGEVLRTEAS